MIAKKYLNSDGFKGRQLALLLVILFAVSACGQKGELYLPGDEAARLPDEDSSVR